MSVMAPPRPKAKATPSSKPSVYPRPLRWTFEEFHNHGGRDLLGEGRRCMLIDGVIVEQGPMNHPHAISVEIIHAILYSLFHTGWRIRCQLPLNLDEHNDPQPDIAMISGQPRDAIGHPVTASLIVEVSDTTFDIDFGVKRERYAHNRIPEYWIVDVNTRQLLVFRDPEGDVYKTQLTLSDTDTVSPLAAPTATITVGDLLP